MISFYFGIDATTNHTDFAFVFVVEPIDGVSGALMGSVTFELSGSDLDGFEFRIGLFGFEIFWNARDSKKRCQSESAETFFEVLKFDLKFFSGIFPERALAPRFSQISIRCSIWRERSSLKSEMTLREESTSGQRLLNKILRSLKDDEIILFWCREKDMTFVRVFLLRIKMKTSICEFE